MTLKLLTLPIIGALIGWVTNYIAVKMLFRPRKARRFLFVTWHGVFPKRQQVLAKKIAEVVSRELLSSTDIANAVSEYSSSPEVNRLVIGHIDRLLNDRLPQVVPILGLVIPEVIRRKLKDLIENEVSQVVSEFSQNLGQGIQRKLDIEKLVEEKVSAYSSEKLEELLLEVMRKELRFVELVGGVLGLIIGCVQLLIVLLEV